MNNLKLFKSISAIALMGTMTLTGLTGCSNKKQSLLDDTILEASYVVEFENGNIDIANSDSICKWCDSTSHPIHHSIITGEYYVSEECKVDYSVDHTVNKYSITDMKNLTSYLSTEEIIKASKGELTDDDIVVIVNRVLDKETEKTNTK